MGSPCLAMAGPLAVSLAVLQENREGLGYLTALSLRDRAVGDLPLARTAMASARNEVRGLDSGLRRKAEAEIPCLEFSSQHGGNSIWYVSPPYDPVLVSGTCEFVTLQGKRDFVGMIKLRALRREKNLDYLGGSNLKTWALQSKSKGGVTMG